MPERSNGPPWKGGISERVSRVRIPLFPQVKSKRSLREGFEKLLPYFRTIHIVRKWESCTAAVSREIPSLSTQEKIMGK